MILLERNHMENKIKKKNTIKNLKIMELKVILKLLQKKILIVKTRGGLIKFQIITMQKVPFLKE